MRRVAVWMVLLLLAATAGMPLSTALAGGSLPPDGSTPEDPTWERLQPPGDTFSPAYGNGLLGRLTSGPDRGRLHAEFSADGTHWRSYTLPEPLYPVSLVFVNGRFGILGQGPEPAGSAWFWSEDGIAWDGPGYLGYNEGAMLDVAYGNGLYVMSNGLFSTDGLTWTQAAARLSGQSSAVFDNGRFILTGNETPLNVPQPFLRQHGVIYTSEDGQRWQKQDLGEHNTIGGAVVCNGLLVVDTFGPKVYRPTEGETWAAVNAPSHFRLSCAGNRLIASGAGAEAGKLFVSADGVSWAPLPTAQDFTFLRAVLSEGRLFLIDQGSILVSSPLCGSFLDLAGADAACGPVTRLTGSGVLAGFPDGLFHPSDLLTRAQAAKMLVLAVGHKPEPLVPLAFTDVAGHWSANAGYLQAAVALGALNGYPDGTFQPEARVSRTQLIKMAAAANGLTPSSGSNSAGGYADVAATDWYAVWIPAALREGLIGSGASTPLWTGSVLLPESAVTRAEAAILLDNLIHGKK